MKLKFKFLFSILFLINLTIFCPFIRYHMVFATTKEAGLLQGKASTSVVTSAITDGDTNTYFTIIPGDSLVWSITSSTITKLYYKGPNDPAIMITLHDNLGNTTVISAFDLPADGYYTLPTPVNNVTEITIDVDGNATGTYDVYEFDAYQPTDTTPPAEVSNLNETHTNTQSNLSWTNPTDSDFSHIKILRDGVEIANNITGTSFQDNGLSSSTTYNYTLKTVDNSGNESIGAMISVSTNGTLTITAPTITTDFGTITINNLIDSVNANLSAFVVEDNTGTGNGWNVTVESTPFTQSNATGNPAIVLPKNTLTLNGIENITQTSGTSNLPTIQGTGPWTIDNGPVTILSAATGEGMGTFEITFPANALSLNVDTSKKVVDALNNPTVYESTITWTVSNGP
jgi:hypothetical protein